MDRFQVAAVVPAFNEEESIFNVVKSLLPFCKVIVVNDFSTDNTSICAANAGAIVIDHKENTGYDGALNSGFKAANELGVTKIITFDADGQHPIESIPDFISELERYDIVLGVRPKTARAAEYIFSKLSNFKWGIKDPLCGMKGYNIRVYIANAGFDHNISIGTELAIQSVKRNYSVLNLDIPISDRLFGKPRFAAIMRANMIIFRAMIIMLFLKD